MIRMKHPIHGFHCPQGNEEADMRKNGWAEDIQESTTLHVPFIAPKPTRQMLVSQAEEKGVKVDQRWSNDRLVSEIEKA